MSPELNDTHPDMEALHIRLLSELPPWRKLQMMAELNTAARRLAIIGLRERYPNASEAEIRRRLADLLLGEELARRVYGDYSDGDYPDGDYEDAA
jgi:hypothetical protein